jgi:hypothetical protein
VRLVGYEVQELASRPDGRLDLERLRALITSKTAAIMVTNPNTVGLFETDFQQMAEMIHGVDGLGNPFGFWRRLRRFVKRVLPQVQKYASFIPGYGPAIAAGIKAATPLLPGRRGRIRWPGASISAGRRMQMAGTDGYAGRGWTPGALCQAPDGSLPDVGLLDSEAGAGRPGGALSSAGWQLPDVGLAGTKLVAWRATTWDANEADG